MLLVLATNCSADDLSSIAPPGYKPPLLSPKMTTLGQPLNLNTVVKSPPAFAFTPSQFAITAIERQGTNLIVRFQPGTLTNQVYQLAKAATVNGNYIPFGSTTTDNSLTNPAAIGFYRVVATNQVTPGEWVRGIFSSNFAQALGVKQAANGDLIVVGYYVADVNIGGTILPGNGINSDAFLCRYSASGDLLWARRIASGSGGENPTCMAIDASGNLIVGGTFSGTANFGGTNHLAAGQQDCWLAKYDANGNFLWDVAFGGTQGDQLRDLATDSAGDVVVAGFFTGQITSGPFKLNSDSASDDLFLLKFSSAGAFQWCNPWSVYIPETDTHYDQTQPGKDYATGMAVDAANNIFLLGYYLAPPDIGGGTLSPPSVGAGLIAKFSPLGVHYWSRGVGTNFPSQFFALTLDAAGNPIVGGMFHAQTVIGGVTNTGTSSVGTDGILAKFSSTDGSALWSRVITGTHVINLKALASAGDTFSLTGNFDQTYHWDAFTATTLPSASANGFISRHSASTGAAQSAAGFGGPGSDGGQAVCSGASMTAVAGFFSGTATIDNATLTATNGTAGFVWRQ